MPTLLEQLPDDDSVLLMYLADELPEEDRARIDRRLAADAGLRQRLAALGETHDVVMAGLERLDASAASPSDESAAVRRAASAIRQWQARSAAAAAVSARREAPAPPLRWRAWAIPAAAAALVLLVLGVAFHGLTGHKGPVASMHHRHGPAAPPPEAPQPTDPGNASAGAAEEEEFKLVMAVPRDLPDGQSIDEGVGSPERDVRDPQNEPAGREETAENKPLFDIPLDPGQ